MSLAFNALKSMIKDMPNEKRIELLQAFVQVLGEDADDQSKKGRELIGKDRIYRLLGGLYGRPDFVISLQADLDHIMNGLLSEDNPAKVLYDTITSTVENVGFILLAEKYPFEIEIKPHDTNKLVGVDKMVWDLANDDIIKKDYHIVIDIMKYARPNFIFANFGEAEYIFEIGLETLQGSGYIYNGDISMYNFQAILFIPH